MSKSRARKEQEVAKLQDRMERSQAIILADYRGLKVAEITRLRRQLQNAGADLQVVKNTLAWRAAQDMGWEDLAPYLEGPTAMAFAPRDETQIAKILVEFAREHKVMGLKGAVLAGRVFSGEGVKALAELPSREELLARVAGGMAAPLSGLAGCLQGLLRNLVYVLEAVREQQEAQSA
ncbi:MAG: 50S ribosomal protein L10 [Clostridia bacterium]|nr:MAG: 50S ribosomal protein L10 [Clostridia bacterium]